jgi:guanylate kinase
LNKPGRLIVLSGPSGVGKTTICQEIVERRRDIIYSISATSRRKRKGERSGREYFFLTEKEFKEWIERGLFAEHALVHGKYYGTPRKYLDDNIKQGRHVLMDIDVQGAAKLMKQYHDGIFIFIVPPDFSELERRLLCRNTDDKGEIESRLKTALEEMKYRNEYKYSIENSDLNDTVSRVISIIDAETEEKKK